MFVSVVFAVLALRVGSFVIAHAGCAFLYRFFFVGAISCFPTNITSHYSEESASHPPLRIAESATSFAKGEIRWA